MEPYEELKTIDSVFKKLGPGSRLTDRYLFRGQRKDWPIVPLAFRSDVLKVMEPLFTKDDTKTRNAREVNRVNLLGKEIGQRYREFRIINRFIHLLDDAGVALPGDDAEFRETLYELRMNHKPFIGDISKEVEEIRKKFSSYEKWPPRVNRKGIKDEGLQETFSASWCAVLALAQHYDLPTRLLDWSVYSYVALYHAANGVMKKKNIPQKNSEFMYIYKFDTKNYQLNKEKLFILEIPGNLNPNLAAQKGRMILLNMEEKEQRKGYENIDGIKEAIVKKYRIHNKFAKEILERLKTYYLSRDTLFPGLRDIADSMHERAHYLSLTWDNDSNRWKK